MKKIIVGLIMLVCSSMTHTAQMPIPLEPEPFGQVVYSPTPSQTLSEGDSHILYCTVAGLTLQCASLVVLKLLRMQGVQAIPLQIPFINGTALHTKKTLAVLSIVPSAITYLMIQKGSENKTEFSQNQMPREAIPALSLLSGVAGFAILVQIFHDDYLLQWLKARKAQPLIIKSKIDFDADFLADKACPICLSDIAEPISCCTNEEHVYCKECLVRCFAEKERIEERSETQFSCLLCMQKITQDNKKIEINRFNDVLKTKDFIKSLVGIDGIFLIMATCNLCYLVFLTLT